jgi:hypothetical protein
VITQAGAYGEHRFTAVESDTGDGPEDVDANAVRTTLQSGTRVTLSAEMDRFANDPSYAFPWA